MPEHKDNKVWPEGTELVCLTPCQHRGRHWNLREKLTAQADEIVPHHFILAEKMLAAKPEKNDPVTEMRPKEYTCPDCGDLVSISGKGAHSRWCKGKKDQEKA